MPKPPPLNPDAVIITGVAPPGMEPVRATSQTLPPHGGMRAAAELAHMTVEAEANARQQARLAALAEAQRLADEQASLAAQAAAQHIATEQARLAELEEAQRQAELLRRETEQQENLQAQERLRQYALKTTSTYPASGASAVSV